MSTPPDRTVLLAFIVFVLFAGANAIGVKFAIQELDPMWAAGSRFAVAGLLLAGAVLVQGRTIPRGTRLTGTLLFGIFGFGLPYFFLYQGLRSAPAGTTMLMLAVVPLLTVLLSVLQGTERLRPLGVAGALVAFAGIVIVWLDQASLDIPIVALAALLAAAFCQAQASVVVKRFPPGDPVSANAIGMLLGAAMLVVAAAVAGETFAIPTQPTTWLAMAYLIGPGSIVVFVLVLFVLEHWTASATSYAFLLFPLVAILLGALLLQEPIRPAFLVGGAVVLLGVYIGAVYRPRARPGADEPAASPETLRVEP